MVNVIHFVRKYWPITFLPLGFVMGWYFDRRCDENLTAYRNKSQLFQRELQPGEEVLWK